MTTAIRIRTLPTTTTLSTKGQIVIPKIVRDTLAWPDGMTLAIEQHANGLLLSAAKHHFKPTQLQSVRGCMNYKGPALTPEKIDEKSALAFAKKWKQDNQ